MKPTMCPFGMVLSSFRWSPRCHTVSYAALKSRNTTQLSRCAESSLQCIVLVVLLGSSLMYHGRSRLAPEEAVDPPLGEMWLCINISRILNRTQSSEMGRYDLGVYRATLLGLVSHACPSTTVKVTLHSPR